MPAKFLQSSLGFHPIDGLVVAGMIRQCLFFTHCFWDCHTFLKELLYIQQDWLTISFCHTMGNWNSELSPQGMVGCTGAQSLQLLGWLKPDAPGLSNVGHPGFLSPSFLADNYIYSLSSRSWKCRCSSPR